MRTDVVLTLCLLTVATVPFYMLGAGVLHRTGSRPDGLDTVRVLSQMYTETLGEWAWWLFVVGAFCVLFSTVVSGLGAGARVFADAMGVLGMIDPTDYRARKRVLRIWAVVSPAVMALCYFFIQNPVLMLTIGGTIGAMMMPVVAGNTIFLRYRHTHPSIAPAWRTDVVLWVCFVLTLALGAYAAYGVAAG
jgi:Mn2+/Fe2+ NRAMP family transporter